VARYPELHARASAAGAQYRPEASWTPLVQRLEAAL
jgi:hypothetical protein